MEIKILRSAERGRTQLDWLDSYHSFSFGEYFNPRQMGFKSLRVINDDIILANSGFPLHPHREMEILTFVVEGALAHTDSTGNILTLNQGSFQLMSAGRGIRHSEFNPQTNSQSRIIQIWILPKKARIDPSYQDLNSEFQNGIHLVCAPEGAPLIINQEVEVYLANLKDFKSEKLTTKYNNLWVQVISGVVNVNNYQLTQGDGLSLEEQNQIELSATKAQVLIFSLN